MAQTTGLPQYGVLLEGTANEPKLINNSPHRIVVYALIYDKRGTNTLNLLGQLLTEPISEVGIAPGSTFWPTLGAIDGGTSRRFPAPARVRDASGLPLQHTSVALDAVLFEDGHFVGPDQSGTYDRLTNQIQQEQEIAAILLNTTDRVAAWASIESIASNSPEPPARGRYSVGAGPQPPSRAQFARQLLLVRSAQGDAGAIRIAESTKNYPVIVKVE